MNIRQLSFAGGEISPALHGRVDLVKYSTGLKALRNFMVMRHGGITNRPGTGYVAEIKDSTKAVKLIPFIYTSSLTYILEFGHEYIRIYKNGSQIKETPKAISGVSNANPCVITINSHGYSNGDEVWLNGGVSGTVELNYESNYRIANVTTNTFSLKYIDGTNVNSTTWGTYISGGQASKIYQITSPYSYLYVNELKYVQSRNVLTLTHPVYAPKTLTCTDDTTWALSTITFGATITAPTGQAATQVGTPGSTTYNYKVSAVAVDTNEESLPSGVAQVTNGNATLSATNYINVTWTAVSGAGFYNIYKEINGQYGFIGVSGGTSFYDIGYTPDALDIPPIDRQPFSTSNNYPAVVAYYQQRHIFANTYNNPETAWTSRTGLKYNLMGSTPIQNDDAITFTILGKQYNEVLYFLDIGKMVLFTSSGEWIMEGDASGVLTPGDINLRQHTANGSGSLPPISINGSAVYVQARGSVIRDLGYDYQSDGYRGNELTIFASHLFDGYTLSDWAYQQIPHSIIWVVRSDGALLGLTYIREHQVVGWHRHDTDGTVENVAVIPSGKEDILYMVIKRTINGRTVRYVEYLNSRQFTDINDAVFVDCSAIYNGTNIGAATMTLSGGTNWTYDETLTVTSSLSNTFKSTDIGNGIHFTDSDGVVIRFTIAGYTSGTIVTGTVHKTVPTTMRNIPMTTWAKAVNELAGLRYLEGKKVSVIADGFVVANPNNVTYMEVTVTNGRITLDRPYAIIHVGLPIVADVETLNIDSPNLSTIMDKKKSINRLSLMVESSRGIWAGPDSDNLTEFKLRSAEAYDAPTDMQTGLIELNIMPNWRSSGSIFIRQTDPLPLSILSIIPAGFIGG